MKRLATLFALAAVALAVGCGSDTELKSMNFDRHVTVGGAVQSVDTPRSLFR